MRGALAAPVARAGPEVTPLPALPRSAPSDRARWCYVVRSFARSFVRSFVRLLARSFARSFSGVSLPPKHRAESSAAPLASAAAPPRTAARYPHPAAAARPEHPPLPRTRRLTRDSALLACQPARPSLRPSVRRLDLWLCAVDFVTLTWRP